jgi:opacity protein-like surface antigen
MIRRFRILQSAILVMVVSVSVPCFSQPNAEGAPALAVGWKGFFGSATFYREGGDDSVLYRYRLSYGAGLTAYLRIFNGSWGHLGVQPELLWIRRATRTEFDNGVLGSRYRLDSADLPVLARASYQISDRVTLHAAAGPRLGYQLDAKRTDINGNVQDLTDLRKFELGVSIGVGGSIELTHRFALMLEGRYDQVLVDIADADEEVDLRHRAFFLVLGVSMGVGSLPRTSVP